MNPPESFPSHKLLHGDLTQRILANFFDVYNELGTGFLESVYHAALAEALKSDGLQVDREVPMDVFFRQAPIGRFYADIVVDAKVIVEVKAIRVLTSDHQAQLLHYLRSTAMEVGLLLNFGPTPQYKRRIYTNNLKWKRLPK